MHFTSLKKKPVLIISIIVLFLIAVVLLSGQFNATPLLSDKMLFRADYSNGPIMSQEEEDCADKMAEKYSYIDWPERRYCYLCSTRSKYIEVSNYIIRFYLHGIDVYNTKTQQLNTIVGQEGDVTHMQAFSFITEKEICFSKFSVDVANWPTRDDGNGTYKYTFETGVLEKISNSIHYSLKPYSKNILCGESMFIPHIMKFYFLF